jgi:putative holliday junction resolvase
VVVGLPLEHGRHPQRLHVPACRKFARRLNGRYNLPFYTHDERLTTFEAKGERRDRGGQKGSYRDNPSMPSPPPCCCRAGWMKTLLYLNPD